jgi:undecaprenyl pyrophosphate synthase
VQAVRRIVREGIPEDQVTEELIGSYMYTGICPILT